MLLQMKRIRSIKDVQYMKIQEQKIEPSGPTLHFVSSLVIDKNALSLT